MEVTIEITDECPYACAYCSTNASLTNPKHLSPDAVRTFLINTITSHGEITRLNISGGEPLLHPQFVEILKICQTYVQKERIHVYTNEIVHLHFNTDVVKEVYTHGHVCLVPGEHYIPKHATRIHLLKFIPQGRGINLSVPNITVSTNLKTSDTSSCLECMHVLLQADGKVVPSPCKKEYGEPCDK